MAEEFYKPSSTEDEYSLSEGEQSSSSTSVFSGTAIPEKPNPFEKINRKTVMTGIGILLGIFVLYKVADMFMSSSTSSKKEAMPRVSMPISSAPVQMQQPIAAIPEQGQMPQRVSALEQQITNAGTAFQKMNSQMNDVQASITSMSARLDSINSSLQTLSTQVAQQQAYITAQQNAKRKVSSNKKIAPKPIFFVQAIIPGRAWLVTPNGKTMTVGLGDPLPGYGVIQAIDSDQGTIITSTGAIIGYSPSER